MKLLILLTALAGACAQAEAPAPDARAAGRAGVLIVGNKGEDSVSFIDLATGAELGRAASGRAPHEVAVSPDGKQAAVVAYGGNSIDIFDVATRSKLRTISLGANQGPHGLVWLDDERLVATTERSRSLVIVDPAREDAVTAIGTGQEGTHMVAVTSDRRRAFTANIGSGTVSVIDLVAGTKVRDIAAGGQPEAIALSADGKTLWVGDLEGARVQAFNTGSFERVAEVRTGAVPIRLVTTPDGRWVISSNAGAGTLTIIDARTRKLEREVSVSGSRDAAQVTIILSRDGKRLYAAETGRDQVAEVDLATGKVLRRIGVGKNGDGLAIAP